ncbi:histidine ammonia-lyase [bacterium]|nr:histidine ammonia-lyase [bacterium]
MSQQAQQLDTSFMSLKQVNQLITSGAAIEIAEEVLEKTGANRSYLDQKLSAGNQAFYGINTGFGSLCNTVIPNEELEELQVNLVRSHACGTGALIDNDLVKLILLLKIKSLSYGFSGVRPVVLQQLAAFYNHGILPCIHEQGSLGASGDLAPLAHLTMALMGEGKAHWNHEVKSTSEVLAQLQMPSLSLKAKEGLALLNGTQFMLGHLVHCLIEGYKLWQAAHHIAALSLEGFNCRLTPFYPGLGEIRPHEGQQKSAELIRKLLADSALADAPNKAVQDPYSFRCIPQVHGATYTTLKHCQGVAETEMNAVTDNPIVFNEADQIISGGNFHGQELALALDFLGIALAELGSISERRTYLLISGSRGLNPYLSPRPGTRSGFMIPQYTAASIVSQNKQLATPASVDSIPSSNGQEDHVSMGANAATKCKRIVDNVRTVLAIELMTAAQAWEQRSEFDKASQTSQLMAKYRKVVPSLDNDRFLSEDITKTVAFVKQEFTAL